MMYKLLRQWSIVVVVILLNGCGKRVGLAPVSEISWHPLSQNQSTHTVRSGETLYAIAFRYDTDYRRLAQLNHLHAPYSLRVGQVLNVRGLGRVRRPVTPRNAYASYPRPAKPAVRAIYSPKSRLYSRSGWLWPVNGRVAATFMPQDGRKGINIACKKDEKVHASSSGVVAYAGSGLTGYGNLIIIKHNNQYLTAYGNNARNLVSEGQHVKSGQIIAVAGAIDRKYWGVHFEIRKAGIPVNPLNYLEKG